MQNQLFTMVGVKKGISDCEQNFLRDYTWKLCPESVGNMCWWIILVETTSGDPWSVSCINCQEPAEDVVFVKYFYIC